MAGPDEQRTEGAPPISIHIERKPTNWLAWLLLALGILALLVALARGGRQEPVATTVAARPVARTPVVIAETPGAPGAAALDMAALGGYLAGRDAAPRRFTFRTLNFATGTSDIRPSEEAELNAVAATLAKYPAARVRIAGYADTRGTRPDNLALGKARADSVKAALVAKGVDAGRIATVSGGESDPVDTNATAAGRAENRRTELVVTQR